MWRHILPNSLTPVVTLVPFEMAAAVGALTSLDFLGLGVPPGTPSLGELLNQGKENLDAWWISLSTFADGDVIQLDEKFICPQCRDRKATPAFSLIELGIVLVFHRVMVAGGDE